MATREDYAKPIAYGQDHFQEAFELLKTLGRIPAPSHHEDARVDFVRNWMQDNGFANVQVDDAKNVIASMCDDGACDLVVFAAHTDVVFPDTQELPMREEGGRLYAPGIGDDTTCLVSMLMAARHLRELIEGGFVSPTAGILVVANSCEEGLGNLDGMKELFRVYGNRVLAFVSFDGAGSEVVTKAVGSNRYRISVETAGGHSFRDFGNPNAIHLLSRIICDLYAIELPDEAHTTTNVGTIEGGTSVNSIAQHASALYEFRSTSQACLDRMTAAFEDVMARYADEDARISVEVLGIRPGNGDVDAERLDALAARCGDIITAISGEPWYTEDGSTDANIPLSLGIPGVTVGIYRGEGAHTREEYIEIDSLPEAIAMALAMMVDLVQG